MDQDHNDDTSAGQPGVASGEPGDAGPSPRPARRPATSLLTWGIVALVLVIVVVLVVIKVTGTSPTTGTNAPAPPAPAPSAVVQAVTKIPASVYDAVGVTSPDATVTPPTLLSGSDPLQAHGLPEVLYVGDEFCPYCAAERWALVAALSRFGKFTGLESSASGTNEAFSSTPTFSFAGTKYSSRYVSATLLEQYGDQKNAAGTAYAPLDPLTRSERGLMARYDRTPSGTVAPFLDIANRAVIAGGVFSPSILQQLTSTQIANGLTDPKDPATQAIVAAANEISAVICAADGQQPATVCASTGVASATSALAITP